MCPKRLTQPMRSYRAVLLLSLTLLCRWPAAECFQQFGCALQRRCSPLHGRMRPVQIKNMRECVPTHFVKMSLNDGVEPTAESPIQHGRDACPATTGNAHSLQKQGLEDFAGPGTWILESEVECDVSFVPFLSHEHIYCGKTQVSFFILCILRNKQICIAHSLKGRLQYVAKGVNISMAPVYTQL
jgi:hypothetical protein